LPAAADNEWNLDPALTGDWHTPANWLTPLFPLDTDIVTIDNGGTAQILSSTAVAKEILLGSTAPRATSRSPVASSTSTTLASA
jgi:hypothetical protein